MATSSNKLRSSFSFPNLFLSCLNFTLFILASASFAPIILIKTPPTSLGWALLISSAISLFTSFLGFYARLAHFCFVTHMSFLLASLASQALCLLALFLKEKSSLSMLASTRDPREAKLLVRLECGILMAMFLLQVVVLVMTCVVHSCWVREYESLEGEREAMAKKRSRKMAEIHEESMINVGKINEGKAKELEEKMKIKYGGQWVKNDVES
ncbi:uncharacterized protein LOC141597147 [Silene latifolia]|uniref:uncharacterized protein LOC141597147 n=1 Tax=Silene latifolia TaxID=37657 RepID=UPI003D76A468